MEGDLSLFISIFLFFVSLLISSIFSVVKIVFSSFVSTSLPSDDEYKRYLVEKTETILENRTLFDNTVAFGRIFFNICCSLFSFLAVNLLSPYLYLYQKVLISLLITLIFLTLIAYNISRALAKCFFRNIFFVCYYIYKIFVWLFFPPVSLFIAVYKQLLKIFEYDEKLVFLSDKEKSHISEKKRTDKTENSEREMIHRIFSLSEKTVSDIMTPRINIKGIELETPLKTIFQIVKMEGHSRLPVFQGTIDSIIGILYTKDLLLWVSEHQTEKWDLKRLLKKPLYVPANKKVSELMNDFNTKHVHIAIVVDEYGGTEGLVTMEDILEEIVGEIQDEYDREEEKEIIKISDSVYIVEAQMDLKELSAHLGIRFDTDGGEYNTLSGLIYNKYGDIPQEKSSFDYGNCRMTILKMDNQKIEKVRIDIKPQSASHDVSGF